MLSEDLQRELTSLKNTYRHTLDQLQRRVSKAVATVGQDDITYTSHDAFNMSATCQELTMLAGKIEQTTNVLRWMKEAK